MKCFKECILVYIAYLSFTSLVGHSAEIPKDSTLEEPHPWNVKNSITYRDSQRNASSEEEDGFRGLDTNDTQETKTTNGTEEKKMVKCGKRRSQLRRGEIERLIPKNQQFCLLTKTGKLQCFGEGSLCIIKQNKEYSCYRKGSLKWKRFKRRQNEVEGYCETEPDEPTRECLTMNGRELCFRQTEKKTLDWLRLANEYQRCLLSAPPDTCRQVNEKTVCTLPVEGIMTMIIRIMIIYNINFGVKLIDRGDFGLHIDIELSPHEVLRLASLFERESIEEVVQELAHYKKSISGPIYKYLKKTNTRSKDFINKKIGTRPDEALYRFVAYVQQATPFSTGRIPIQTEDTRDGRAECLDDSFTDMLRILTGSVRFKDKGTKTTNESKEEKKNARHQANVTQTN